jgi:hypothetical protein
VNIRRGNVCADFRMITFHARLALSSSRVDGAIFDLHITLNILLAFNPPRSRTNGHAVTTDGKKRDIYLYLSLFLWRGLHPSVLFSSFANRARTTSPGSERSAKLVDRAQPRCIAFSGAFLGKTPMSASSIRCSCLPHSAPSYT